MYRVKQRFIALHAHHFTQITQRVSPHKQQFCQLALGAFVIVLLAACTGTSDASRVIETDNVSKKATITYYESLGPTMTAQVDAFNQKISTLQSDLNKSADNVRSLQSQLNQINSGSQPQPAVGQPGPGSDSSLASIPASALQTPGAAQPTATSAPVNPTGMSIEKVVMAKTKDANLCAISETTTFATTDKQIIVIGIVHNFKTGVKFSAKWSGPNFDRQDDWLANYDSPKHCVWFYIEPVTVGLKAGSYTVTFIAGDTSAAPVAFTVQ